MAHTLMGWLDQHHPEITTELLMGVVEHDEERTAALRDPEAAEKWVKRHHTAEYKEWKRSPDGPRSRNPFHFSRR